MGVLRGIGGIGGCYVSYVGVVAASTTIQCVGEKGQWGSCVCCRISSAASNVFYCMVLEGSFPNDLSCY